MPYKRSAAMAKTEPAAMALRRNPRKSGPWDGMPLGLPSIVQFKDEAIPCNEYPARTVSPPRPAACCATNMVNVGDPQENVDV